MKTSVQIFSALALTSAVAAWPFYAITGSTSVLNGEAAQSASIIKGGPTNNPSGLADAGGSKAKSVDGVSIAPGVSPKEAAEIIANLGAIDGRLLSGREILEIKRAFCHGDNYTRISCGRTFRTF